MPWRLEPPVLAYGRVGPGWETTSRRPPQFANMRYWCTARTAADPSPTAAATRFVEPERTSPTANRPGWLVSKGSGDRPRACHPSPSCSAVSAASVRTKLWSSSAAHPESQADAGSAPMNESGDGGAGAHGDRRVRLDTIDEVARHALAEVAASDDDRDRAAGLCQEDGRLAGRVTPADDEHRRATALTGLQVGGGVIHAPSFELAQAVGGEASVGGAGGGHHGPSRDLAPVAQRDHQVAAGVAQRRRRARRGEPRAELLRLDDGPLRQVGTRDAHWEPEVVLDPRGRAGLAAGRRHLDAQGPQALGRPVDRGRQTGRPPTDHDEVEESFGQAGRGQAEEARQLPGRGLAQDAPGHDDDRQIAGLDRRLPQQVSDLVTGVDVEPLMRHASAREELTDPQRLG